MTKKTYNTLFSQQSTFVIFTHKKHMHIGLKTNRKKICSQVTCTFIEYKTQMAIKHNTNPIC